MCVLTNAYICTKISYATELISPSALSGKSPTFGWCRSILYTLPVPLQAAKKRPFEPGPWRLIVHKLSVVCTKELQVRFGSTVDWNCPQFCAHTQVLSNHSSQGYAGHIDEPPGQGSWGVRVVDPAANQMEEVHGDGEVEALLPSPDEKPQAEGTARKTKSSAALVCSVWAFIQTRGKVPLAAV